MSGAAPPAPGVPGVAAFSLHPVSPGLGKLVRSVCPWAPDRLVVGLADGKVVLFGPEEKTSTLASSTSVQGSSTGSNSDSKHPPSSQASAPPSYQALRTVNLARAGGRGEGIGQLEAFGPGKDALWAVTEEGVSLYDLPAFHLRAQASGSRGALSFAWDGETGNLAVVTKRRVQVYHYDGKELLERRSFGVADAVCAAWCGDSLCVGTKKQYLFLNPTTGAVSEGAIVGKATKPAAIRTGEAEVMVLTDSSCLFLGPHGRQLHKPLLTWHKPPLAAAYSSPYAVAFLPGGAIDVRNAGRTGGGSVQTIPAPPGGDRDIVPVVPGSAGADRSLVVTSGPDLVRLAPAPWAAQARALAKQGEFQDALELCACVDDRRERAELQDRLRIRYGRMLCVGGEYGLGLAQFGMCKTKDPLVLLSLFPSLVPASMQPDLPSAADALDGDDARLEVAEPPEAEMVEVLYTLLQYLYSHRSRLAALAAHRNAESKPAAVSAGGAESAAPDTPPPGGSDAGGGDDEDADDADVALRELPEAKRERLAVVVDTVMCKVLLRLPDRGELLRFLQQPNAVDLYEGEAALRAAGMYAELCSLYRGHDRHSRAMTLLQKLSQSPDELEPPPKGAAAELGGRTGAWAALRYIVAMGAGEVNLITQHCRWILRVDPEAALEALLSMDPPLPPDMFQQILQATVPHMVATYLEAALEAGIATPELAHPELVRIYLKQAAAAEQRLGPIFKRRRVRRPDLSGKTPTSATRRKARDWSKLFPSGAAPRSLLQFSEPAGPPPSSEQPSVTEGEVEGAGVEGEGLSREDVEGIEAHEKLVQLVCLSPHIDARDLLKQLSRTTLTEIRALLLERVSDHRSALHSYVYELHDAQLAEAYCDRVYEACVSGKMDSAALRGLYSAGDVCSPGDIYIALLAAYLQGPVKGGSERPADGGPPRLGEGEEPTWEALAALLSRKVPRLNAAPALELLQRHAADVPVQVLLPFLQALLNHRQQKGRRGAVETHLRRSEHLTALEELDTVRRSYVLLTPMRACSICHKRIGTSVFVRQPDSSLLHYSCYRRHTSRYTELGAVREAP